ncbi:prolyl-tRNA synthetase associated domain-containing protein [Limosilactobacillus gorillae]|uniref:prolyl-tRNA synthetase associated domain-containing protein n=1 Tax=Limosilactobacillus gorillae TaxID=1450649 RepID=UPI000AF07487|nr:prolyl-tRNA synthetase associated domain-containing protein [Limosilactobacillus gorillae]
MNQEQVYQYLDDHGINYEVINHPAVFDMAAVADFPMPHPEANAKNLFVRDDKHRHYYLITVKGQKQVDLKALRDQEKLRRLSFASPADLQEYLGLTPGAVTPLGALNDPAARVEVLIDQELADGLVAAHPNVNTATVWLRTSDLVKLLEDHGNAVRLIKIPER